MDIRNHRATRSAAADGLEEPARHRVAVVLPGDGARMRRRGHTGIRLGYRSPRPRTAADGEFGRMLEVLQDHGTCVVARKNERRTSGRERLAVTAIDALRRHRRDARNGFASGRRLRRAGGVLDRDL